MYITLICHNASNRRLCTKGGTSRI